MDDEPFRVEPMQLESGRFAQRVSFNGQRINKRGEAEPREWAVIVATSEDAPRTAASMAVHLNDLLRRF